MKKFLSTLSALLALSSTAFSATYQVTDTQIQADKDGDTLALAINGPEDTHPVYDVFIRHKPERLVIEMKQTGYSSTLPAITSAYSSTLVRRVRMTAKKDDAIRYILDLNYPPASFNYDLSQIGADNYLLRVHLVMPKAAINAKLRNDAKKLIVPTDSPGVFELHGNDSNKTLEFDGSRRTSIKAKEFISLFDGQSHVSPVDITGAALQSFKDRSELTLDLSGPAQHSLSILHRPLRAVIDIKHAHKPGVINGEHLSSDLVTQVRSGQHHKYLRVVIELPVAVYLRTYLQSPGKDHGYRLIVRITRAFPAQQSKK